MHPRGTFISPLMKTVKKVYSQIETVEKWTDNAKYVPEIGVYCTHNKTKEQHNTFIENLNVFKGAQRVLAELKYCLLYTS